MHAMTDAPAGEAMDGRELLAMHRTMLRIRHFEETIRRIAASGGVPGLVHLCAGQEATNVGIISALSAEDYIASHHRGHGHCIARGTALAPLMAEILGRATGICGGRSGSMHVFDLERGNLGTNGIVGGGIPLACGAALAARARGESAVAICFFGDGALNQGLLHECMNMAAIWKLGVVFVCENNGYGEFTAIDDVTAGPSLTARGEVFGIPSTMVDGMDVTIVRAAADKAVARARAGEGPSFIICNTWRFGGHHVGDAQEYKDTQEAQDWRARDPLLKSARMLIEAGVCTQSELDEMDQTEEQMIRKISDQVRHEAEPAAAALADYVYGMQEAQHV